MATNLPMQIQAANELAVQALHALQTVNMELQESNARLAAKVEELAPKAEGYARFLESVDTIDMTMAASRIAEALGISLGLNRLYSVLRLMGIVRQDKNCVYQEYAERGYFVNSVVSRGGQARAYVRVTPKGLVWLIHRIEEWAEADKHTALIADSERRKK